jgi:hypothetical protein
MTYCYDNIHTRNTQGLGPGISLELADAVVDPDLGISTYTTTWECSLDICKKNSRHALQIDLKVEVRQS